MSWVGWVFKKVVMECTSLISSDKVVLVGLVGENHTGSGKGVNGWQTIRGIHLVCCKNS